MKEAAARDGDDGARWDMVNIYTRGCIYISKYTDINNENTREKEREEI